MKTIPIRETVAGEAFSMLWTSNNSLHEGDIGILSPFARVRVLLSSKTEFKFSIQIASTGPSKIRNTFSPGKDNQKRDSSYHIAEKTKKISVQKMVWNLNIV